MLYAVLWTFGLTSSRGTVSNDLGNYRTPVGSCELTAISRSCVCTARACATRTCPGRTPWAEPDTECGGGAGAKRLHSPSPQPPFASAWHSLSRFAACGPTSATLLARCCGEMPYHNMFCPPAQHDPGPRATVTSTASHCLAGGWRFGLYARGKWSENRIVRMRTLTNEARPHGGAAVWPPTKSVRFRIAANAQVSVAANTVSDSPLFWLTLGPGRTCAPE